MSTHALLFRPEAPIGVFDSGVGGLSVLRHIQQQCPNESLIYFADSGFAPYGDKSEAQVIERTLFVAAHLMSLGVKALVVACNTATAAAIAQLRITYPTLILVGVEPGLKPAIKCSHNKKIGVLATHRTLASTKYQQLCEQLQQANQVEFFPQACIGLADQIELGELNSPATLQLLKTYCQPLIDAGVDTTVLGCTHYLFALEAIRQIFNQQNQSPMQFIDTGLAIAMQLKRLLAQQQLENVFMPPQKLRSITTGQAAKLEFALTQLLNLQQDDYTIQEFHCNLSPT